MPAHIHASKKLAKQYTTSEEAKCPWCNCEQADWKHVCWDCTQNGRPPDMAPKDPLQERLGWSSGIPSRKGIDTQILTWMASVRHTLLTIRRGGNGHLSSTSPGITLITANPPMENHGRDYILTQTDQAGRYSHEVEE